VTTAADVMPKTIAAEFRKYLADESLDDMLAMRKDMFRKKKMSALKVLDEEINARKAER